MGYLVYIVFGLIASGLTLGEDVFNRNGKKKFSFIFLATLLFIYVLLGSLRGPNVGIDTDGYSANYVSAKSVGLIEFFKNRSPEYSFYGSMYFFSHILRAPEIVYYFFQYGLNAVCLYFAFRKLEHPCLVTSIFFFVGYMTLSFTAVRQCMAAAVVTLAFSIFWNKHGKAGLKDWIIAYVLIIVAMTFHESAFIALPVPLLFLIPLRREYVLVPMLFLPFMFLLAPQALIFVYQVTYFYYSPTNSRISYTLVGMILIFIAFVVVDLYTPTNFLRRHVQKQPMSKTLRIATFIFYAYCYMATFNEVQMSLSRFMIHFYSGIAIIAGILVSSIKNKKLSIAASALIVFAASLFSIYASRTIGVIPYEFVF